MSEVFQVSPRIVPPLDPGFVPAALWCRAYRTLAARDPESRDFALVLQRGDGSVYVYRGRLLSAGHAEAGRNFPHVERLLKFLLWQKGASLVRVAGCDELVPELARLYSAAGARAFDADLMGGRIFGPGFTVKSMPLAEVPEERSSVSSLGRNQGGCRLGFDLGGSARKVVALNEGRLVFASELPWDPYFQADPVYHSTRIQEALEAAAAHLPRVEAIGGSAAGVYLNNEVRVASLFRGIPEERFMAEIRPLFLRLQQRWGGIPLEVVNDGEVTALAGSMSLGATGVLGLSLGTSLACGYVTQEGGLTNWLNELAFVPIDYREGAPADEWSGDRGCCVQYLSQQAVERLALEAGFVFAKGSGLSERMTMVRQALASGDARARAVYESIGVYLGYMIAHCAEFFDLRHVIMLGGVTSGESGALLLSKAREVLETEFPLLAESVRLHLPTEQEKRHGQAIAAASLPRIQA